jgi:NAD(P)H-hydrate epimerase
MLQAISSSVMQAIDREAINQKKIPSLVLMENAGREVAEFILRKWAPQKVVIVAGKGNNGGDALVLARYLQFARIQHKVFCTKPSDLMTADCKHQLGVYENTQGKVVFLENKSAIQLLEKSLLGADVVVDGIFGTGLQRMIEKRDAQIIGMINLIKEKKGNGQKVLAIDIPSGIDAETGNEWGVSVHATTTIAMAFLKKGSLQGIGASNSGDLMVAPIGVDPVLEDQYQADSVDVVTYTAALNWPVKHRALTSHKGTFGHVFTVGGSAQKLGAVKLAAKSALKAGCGLSTAVVPRGLVLPFQKNCLDEMVEGIGQKREETFSPSHGAEIINALQPASAAIVGPGLTEGKGLEEIVFHLIRNLSCPLVIDADGLNLLARNPDILKEKKGELVLTPHPKEMARLMGWSVERVQKNRIEVAALFAKRYGVTLVLKGFRTVVADKEGKVSVNTSGNPDLAKAGMGDVLAGIVASLLAQGYASATAAIRGAFYHGAVGDMMAFAANEETLLASELIESYGMCLSAIRKKNKWNLPSNQILASPPGNWESFSGAI